MSTIQEKVAKLLGKPDQLTSIQCTDLIEKISARLEKIRARVADISSESTGRGDLGPERQRIAKTGTPAELLALEDEERLLNAEDISLCAQRDALRKREEKAQIEEAPGLAKAAIKRLGPALKAAESTSAAFTKARAKVESIQIEIKEARRKAIHAGIEAPPVKPDDFDRLAAMLNWVWTPEMPEHQKGNRNIALKMRRRDLTGDTTTAPADTPRSHGA